MKHLLGCASIHSKEKRSVRGREAERVAVATFSESVAQMLEKDMCVFRWREKLCEIFDGIISGD